MSVYVRKESAVFRGVSLMLELSPKEDIQFLPCWPPASLCFMGLLKTETLLFLV